jgi:hypothetical protein
MKLKAAANKVKRAWQWFKGEAAMTWLWVKNIFFVYLTTKNTFRVFEGYGHFWLAKIYADKRTAITRLNKYCGGKRHYVLPAGNYSLAVLNSGELQLLKKKGYYKGMDIKRMLEQAYYVSQNKPEIRNENK